MTSENNTEQKMVKQAMQLMLALSALVYAISVAYCIFTGKTEAAGMLVVGIAIAASVVWYVNKSNTYG